MIRNKMLIEFFVMGTVRRFRYNHYFLFISLNF